MAIGHDGDGERQHDLPPRLDHLLQQSGRLRERSDLLSAAARQLRERIERALTGREPETRPLAAQENGARDSAPAE
ncbi:MAG TPA: hypothetical protein VNK43_03595 [Gemmatimonadales bacterium]|nr:hypothetical protein [Gemmatimonadales bacterium]